MASPTVIFGGTFNPVHNGHLIVARAVAERLGAERVTLMPAAAPPHKCVEGASADDRVAMLRLAVEGDRLFEVSTIELDREGPSYTYDTLCELRRRRGDDARLVWVVGWDMLGELHGWYRAAEVPALARIVTVARPPMPENPEAELSRLRAILGDDAVGALLADVMTTPLIEISSTDIRRRVREGLAIDYLTPPPTVRYIRERRLYADGD